MKMELVERLRAFPILVDGKSDKEYDKEIQNMMEDLRGVLQEASNSAQFEPAHLLEVRLWIP